jgi:hypothetical protein
MYAIVVLGAMTLVLKPMSAAIAEQLVLDEKVPLLLSVLLSLAAVT